MTRTTAAGTPKPFSQSTIRRRTSTQLHDMVKQIEKIPAAQRTDAERSNLHNAQTELNRRATAMFAPYFKGIF